TTLRREALFAGGTVIGIQTGMKASHRFFLNSNNFLLLLGLGVSCLLVFNRNQLRELPAAKTKAESHDLQHFEKSNLIQANFLVAFFSFHNAGAVYSSEPERCDQTFTINLPGGGSFSSSK